MRRKGRVFTLIVVGTRHVIAALPANEFALHLCQAAVAARAIEGWLILVLAFRLNNGRVAFGHPS